MQIISWKLIYVYFHQQPRLILTICKTVILIHRSCSGLLWPKGNLKPHLLLYIPWVLAPFVVYILHIYTWHKVVFLHWTLYVKGWSNRFSYSKHLTQGFIYFNGMLFICDFFFLPKCDGLSACDTHFLFIFISCVPGSHENTLNLLHGLEIW